MSEWKKVKLGEVCEISAGGDRPQIFSNHRTDKCRIPIYSNGIDNEGLYGFTDTPKNNGNAITITGRGANAGTVFYRKDPFLSIIRLLTLTPNSEIINAKYLFYLLKNKTFLSTGSAQPQITVPNISQFEIEFNPDIETQHRIATILSRYDSLIENYQKQIKLLEEAAQRLYKEWFVDLHFPGHENTKIVDGVPEGWEKKPISQLGEYLNGFAFKPSDWQKSGEPIIKIKEMGNGISNDTPRNNGERVPAKYLVKAGDLLFSWSATLMVIVWSGEDGWLNQHLFKVTPAKGIGREFLLQSISNTIEEFQNLTTGSTMKHIQRNKLDQVFVNVPNDEIMKRYSSIAEKERAEILHLSSQIRLLTEARDRLLPKLMSGEIEV